MYYTFSYWKFRVDQHLHDAYFVGARGERPCFGFRADETVGSCGWSIASEGTFL